MQSKRRETVRGKCFLKRLNLAKYNTTLIFLGLAKPAIKAHSAILCVCLTRSMLCCCCCYYYEIRWVLRACALNVFSSLSSYDTLESREYRMEQNQTDEQQQQQNNIKLYTADVHAQRVRERQFSCMIVYLYARVCILSLSRKSAFYWVVIFFHSHVYHSVKTAFVFFFSCRSPLSLPTFLRWPLHTLLHILKCTHNSIKHAIIIE